MSKRPRSEMGIIGYRVWATIMYPTSAVLLVTCFKPALILASTRVNLEAGRSGDGGAGRRSQLELESPPSTPPSAGRLSEGVDSPSLRVERTQSLIEYSREDAGRRGRGEAQKSPETASHLTPSSPNRVTASLQASPQSIRQGTQVSVNGRTFTVAWKQWQVGTSVRTAISDVGLMQSLGMDLLSTRDWTRQPVQWFSDPTKTPLILTSQLAGAYRYLDVSDFVRMAGWQLQAQGNTLRLSSLPTRVENIRTGSQSWGSRIVIDLDSPTPWQLSDRRTEAVITLDASADSSLIERFKATPPPEQRQEDEDAAPVAAQTSPTQPMIRVESGQNQIILRVSIPAGKRINVFSVPNPNRLVIDLRPDGLVEKDILWAPGIRWHQQYVALGESRFPVVWLEIDPRANRILFRPIKSNPTTQIGTTPLIQMAQLSQASAAINAGFFNRKQQLPLGAIRRDNRWLSGPILNRGAIAWNDQGQFKIGRLSLQETLTTSTAMRFPVLFVNSGYVQDGIARYTPEWGSTYTPLTDNEILVVVQNNRVTAQIPGGLANQASYPIPTDGYLLALRATSTSAASTLNVGTQVSLNQNTTPADFISYPQILGAGPLLLQNRQIVLDAKAEGFSDAFRQQLAIRSVIGTTTKGTLILAAIHDRIGGRGPSLAETAQLMQQMGAIDALNFDGGSSTGLYLGGQLLDRSAYTAARVHNGFGLFLTPLP